MSCNFPSGIAAFKQPNQTMLEPKTYTVAEITREIKELLEMSFPTVRIEGEISNFTRHSSGHLYFTLKDELAQLKCVMWKYQAGRLIFQPQDGIKVILDGKLQVYERGGYYQLNVQQIQPAGIGDLQMAFERLKRKLHAEGLFEERHKQPLPEFPQRIGVITSPTGAAIRDIVSVLQRRFPAVEIILHPVRVQGEGAAPEIAAAIKTMNEYGSLDLLIIGRGGGSLEDLWPFNEEIVARAIYASRLPVISAVGHEIDFTIADFVADRRAPTPSAAAEMAVKDRAELIGNLEYYREKFGAYLKKTLERRREKLQHLRESYAFRRPEDTILQKMQRVDELEKNMNLTMEHLLQLREERLQALRRRLHALSPTAILERGYSICYRENEIVRSVKQIHPLDTVQVRLAHGHFLSQVQMIGESS